MGNALPRFSSRVESSIKYCPGYPVSIIDLLRKECHLTTDALIADVGSGTGKLMELFLSNGCRVVGIEPDPEMGAAAEYVLGQYPTFASIAGSAEATGLPDRSVDVVTVGQTFHWFDRERARKEFARILIPGGWVVLVWNRQKPRGRRSWSPWSSSGRRS